MDALRTPDERFVGLPGYDFSPHYLMVDDTEGGELRMHYLDEGPRSAPVVLMLHGEPSWSYLYRKMVPVIVKAGFRVIVPDLIGFGRSDKPVRQRDYSHSRHVLWIGSLLAQLNLQDINLVCQDWGGLIGLRLVAEQGGRFATVVAANTMLPGFPTKHPALRDVFGKKHAALTAMGFGSWFLFSQLNPVWKAGTVLRLGTARRLSRDVVAAYDAPFPSRAYMAGARVFPRLVMSELKQNAQAWKQLMQWDKPFLCTFSDSDYIMREMAEIFPALIPGCQGQPHTTIARAGHFLQEDQGEVLAGILTRYWKSL